jgi:hypothetical protein
MWSVGSGKMLGIPSLNTDTTSNKFCQGMYNSSKENLICRECYSMSMLNTFRKNCKPKFLNNSKYLSSKIHSREYLPICPSNIGRFHSHGELINSNHLENLMNVCLNQPMTTFSLWTKRKNIVSRVLKNRDKPKNLILIYSNRYVDKLDVKLPKHFDKVFSNVSSNTSNVNCDSKCLDCMKCYTLGETTTQIIEVIK